MSSAPTHPKRASPLPTQNELRPYSHKMSFAIPARDRSVIPALAAGISPPPAPSPAPRAKHDPPPLATLRHPRARKDPSYPREIDPSYPRLSRVSRRPQHQARLPPSNSARSHLLPPTRAHSPSAYLYPLSVIPAPLRLPVPPSVIPAPVRLPVPPSVIPAPPSVIPAQAGTHAVGAAQLTLNTRRRRAAQVGRHSIVTRTEALEIAWIPACAGMTEA